MKACRKEKNEKKLKKKKEGKKKRGKGEEKKEKRNEGKGKKRSKNNSRYTFIETNGRRIRHFHKNVGLKNVCYQEAKKLLCQTM